MKRVFIGVGHGGSDPGAVGIVKEADANLTIALELKRILVKHDIVVGISRTVDEDDDINEEIREANAFAPDLAVEVHNNAGGGDGFEVFVQTNQYAAKSRSAAEFIERRVVWMGQQSRGIKTNSFGWVRLVNAPSVLLEGFFVDSKDAYDFETATKQKRLARAYALGILDYFDIHSESEDDDMTGEEIYMKLNEYLLGVPAPSWAKKELDEAIKMGITDGTNPCSLIPRYQAAIMAKRAVESVK